MEYPKKYNHWIVVFLASALLSCSAENSTGTTAAVCATSKSAAANANATPNSITLRLSNYVTKTAMPNVVVQLDDNGLCLLSNASGEIFFSDLTTVTHDIHIMPPVGYDWESIYNIDASQGVTKALSLINRQGPKRQVLKPKPITSYVIFSGVINNTPGTPSSNSIFAVNLVTDNNGPFLNQYVKANTLKSPSYKLEYGFNLPVGSTLKSNFWAFEYQETINATSSVLVNAINKKFPALKTTADKTNPIIYNLNFTPVTPTELVQFNSVTAPTGLSLTSLHLSADVNFATQTDPFSMGISLHYENQTNLIAKPRYSAFVPPGLAMPDIYVSLSANDRPNFRATWLFRKTIVRSSKNISVGSGIIPIPDFYPNPNIDNIAWTASNKLPLSRTLNISTKSEDKPSWDIRIEGDRNSIKLPQIPTGVTPFFIDSEQYRLRLGSKYVYDDPDYVGKTVVELFRNRSEWQQF